jgi:hypothetical protein
MNDDNLDAELRREFDAIFVPYDAMRAQHMIDRATHDGLTGSRTWARPLAAAAAVLVVAGGGAALAATHSSPHHLPAGGPSSPDPTYRVLPPNTPVPTPSCTTLADARILCGSTPSEAPATPRTPRSTAPTPTIAPSGPVQTTTPSGPVQTMTPSGPVQTTTPSTPTGSPTPAGPETTSR